jgi:dihydroorotate dehydrogenase (NAD+) catalytic subunit
VARRAAAAGAGAGQHRRPDRRGVRPIIRRCEDAPGFDAYELNVSCPNVKEGGAIISTREDLLADAVRAARAATRRPLIVKLAPNVPDIGGWPRSRGRGRRRPHAVNTMPGLLFDLETRRPVLGAGSGGVSGPALLPIGVLPWRGPGSG